MSQSLRVRWQERLDVVQEDNSWQAQIEAHVLRFLLARYHGVRQEAPLAPFPLYEGIMPSGRSHSALSKYQLEARLKHIGQINRDCRPAGPSLIDWDGIAHNQLMTNRRNEREKQLQVLRRERFRTRKERGYW